MCKICTQIYSEGVRRSRSREHSVRRFSHLWLLRREELATCWVGLNKLMWGLFPVQVDSKAFGKERAQLSVSSVLVLVLVLTAGKRIWRVQLQAWHPLQEQSSIHFVLLPFCFKILFEWMSLQEKWGKMGKLDWMIPNILF